MANDMGHVKLTAKHALLCYISNFLCLSWSFSMADESWSKRVFWPSLPHIGRVGGEAFFSNHRYHFL